MSRTIDNILKPVETQAEAHNESHSKHLEMIFKEIYSKDDIELKTDVNVKQVTSFTKGLIFAGAYNCTLVRDAVNKQMELLVSKNRGGRKEFTHISSNINNPNTEMETSSKGLFDRLLGGK